MKRFIICVAFVGSISAAYAQVAPTPVSPPDQGPFKDAAIRASINALHNAQDQVISLQAQIDLAGQQVGALQVKAAHADALDAWVKAYFASEPPAMPKQPTP